MQSKVIRFVSRNRFFFGAIFVFIFFAIGRWGIWNYFPFAVVYTDSCEYYELAYNIHNHQIPSFHFIGGGYPLILSLTKAIYDSPFSIILFQQLLSLFSVLLLLFSFRKNSYLFMACVIFGVIYLISDTTIKWEIAVFTDSLFSNLFLIAVSLFYLSYIKKQIIYPILLSFVLFYGIFTRSSAIFVIPLVLIAAGYFWGIKKTKTALSLSLSFMILCILLASYNRFFSLDNQFSILTYGRSAYSEGAFNNSTVKKTVEKRKEKMPILTKQENDFAEEILKKSLPQNNDIWVMYFSWDFSRYTIAVINTRYGLYTEMRNDSLFYCRKGNMNDLACYPIVWDKTVSQDSLNYLITNFKMDDKILKIKSFLAYHFNLRLNYDQAYYGMVPNAYKTTVDKSNQFIHSFSQFEKGGMLLKYLLGRDASFNDDIGFEKRWTGMASDPIFRMYDIFNEKVNKIIFRNSVWLFLPAISLFLILFKIFYNRQLFPEDAVILFIGLIVMGSSLVFTFFGNALPRYSFTTEFCYYLIPLLYLGRVLNLHSIRINIENAPK